QFRVIPSRNCRAPGVAACGASGNQPRSLGSAVIRPAIASDIPEILRLIHQPDMSAEKPVTPQRALAILDALSANPGQELYVAVEGDRIVGTFSLTLIQHLSHSGARSAVIEDFVVDQALRGRGIGGGMLEFAIAKARET